jgi:hypothetical protein
MGRTSMHNRLLILVATAALFTPATAGAQAALAVPPGAVVRLSSPAFVGTATVVQSQPGSLRIVVEGLADLVDVPPPSITRIERRRPATMGERVTRGAVWGGGIAAALGLLMVMPGLEGEGVPTHTEIVLSAGLGGAMWGSLIGLAIPHSRWDPVPLAPAPR